jgi:bacillithiol biosynthesis cysteine-adding enzyme BshC
VLFSSDDPRVKRMASAVLVAEARDWASTHAAHSAATRDLEAAGFGGQVEPRPVHLFRFDGDRRMALDPADANNPAAGVTVRSTHEHVSNEELVALASESPELLSPDVVTRPVVQDALLPTACYVAGPGELAYFGQMAGVYERFGVPMPLIAPRATMTLVEPSIRRALGALEVSVEEILRGDAIRDALESEAPGLKGVLADAETEIVAALASTETTLEALDPSLLKAAGAARARTLKALATLRLKAERVARRRQSDVASKRARVEAALRPAGKIQERALCALGFYARYGPQLAGLIQEAIDLDSRGHLIVDLP